MKDWIPTWPRREGAPRPHPYQRWDRLAEGKGESSKIYDEADQALQRAVEAEWEGRQIDDKDRMLLQKGGGIKGKSP